MSTPKIDPEFEALIPPIKPDEDAALRAALTQAGRALDPIKVWRGFVIDGHNRFRICSELGLPFDVQDLSDALPDRAAVKAWMLDNQAARRNLSREKRITLYLLNGQDPPFYVAKHDLALLRKAVAEGEGPRIMAGRMTLATLRRRNRPKRDPAKSPPRGPHDAPAKPPLHPGQEVKGVSTLTGPNGELRGAWNKTGQASADEPPIPIPDDFALKKTTLLLGPDGGTKLQHVSYDRELQARVDGARAAIVAHVAEYVRPAEPLRVVDLCAEDLITLYPLGDPHVGMLAWADEVGESFDLKIAEAELCECMRQLVARAPASALCIVANLGDFWHAQDDKQQTPRGGNKLDVDGRAGKVGRVGLRVMRTLVDTALTKHERAIVRSLPGNHDPHSSFWLPEVMRAAYANEPRVEIKDAFNPYQYDTFGANLFGWAHGDGAKLEALSEIMATDEPKRWGDSVYRYWNTGHVHHWSQKELRGCFVDTHRTLAGRDAWHHHAGYRSSRALKANTYHREWGLDSVAIVGVERVRAALGVAA